ncbi:hypothetical protein JOQ06_016573 [Pogonophryne albipinna]|uniref:HECT domain-containing protein n=1 Tax=Pogonophryne albipinna TaxID=1090488 RepID=A0AAD6AD06_9TELE|nr:hypothetical protein JOQ06_016573 [Pogonophryne albipinna]
MRKAAQDLLAILKAEASGGLFLDYSGQSKTSDPFPEVKKRTGPKTVRVPFFFLASSSEKTPKPSEELILLQAGLGRRSAHVPEDADHKEITNILCEVYPKMAELEGAWLIHKATGKKKKIQFGGGLLRGQSREGLGLPLHNAHPAHFGHFSLGPHSSRVREHAKASLTRKSQSQAPLTGPDQGSLSDLLDNLKGKIDNSKMFKINVTREDLLQRGLKQGARQKQASPRTPSSSPSLENMKWSEMSRCFEGDERGKNPKYNVSAYQDNTFRYCGEIFAASVVQGGPAPNVRTHHTYHYLCHGQLDKDVVKAGTASVDMENLVTEVQDAEEDSLMALTDRIIACGYSEPIKADRKKDILEAIVLHSWLRLLPILQQLRDGLALYGLDELLVEQPLLCQQLFVPGSLQGVDADFLILALSPEYSPEGSVSQAAERRMESQEEDLNTCSDIKPPTVKTFCQWVTGHAHVPLGEAERSNFRVTVHFDHECHLKYGEHGVCYPIVNACSAAITIPTRHFEKASEFEVNMTEAILAGFEFNLH